MEAQDDMIAPDPAPYVEVTPAAATATGPEAGPGKRIAAAFA